MLRHSVRLAFCLVSAAGLAACGAGLVPFVLPWDDASPGAANLSACLHKPAGKFGHVENTADGHLSVGGQRIRFFGTDLSHCANFPLKPDAEKIAARMAKFGINIVRFHIMDIAHYPDGLFRQDSPSTREFEPEAVDRLDYFIAQLKANGIYVDLNLLNYRGFCAADGMPPEIETLPRPHQSRHIPGFFGHERSMELQKEYARMLLAHRNPYTGMTYTEDPAVAFVEICNENGLLSAWGRGKLEELPEVFLAQLRRQWNDWLQARHGTTAAVRQAWGEGAQPLGDEMLAHADAAAVLDDWQLQNNAGAQSTIALSDDMPKGVVGKSLLLKATAEGTAPWHVLLNRPGFDVAAGRAYTLRFWAKADAARAVRMRFAQTHAPFTNLSPAVVAEVAAEWREFRFVLTATADEAGARIMIGDLGRGLGTYWLAGMSLRPGGIDGLPLGERLEDASVGLLLVGTFAERTLAAQREWVEFLRGTEDRYWQGMYRYLKDDLKLHAIVIGTAAQWSTPSSMGRMDCVDSHAYWQHPRFLSARRWGGPWTVGNRSMVNETGGMLGGLAGRRVLNRPFSVTEYGGASPNPHSGENLLLAGAYAALQDWDYIAVSRYTLQTRGEYTWGAGMFRGFFDVDQHPTRMLGFIPAIAMFRRGDVRPATGQIVAAFGEDRETDAILRREEGYAVVADNAAGFAPGSALVHRVALAVEGTERPADALAPAQAAVAGPRYVSDTGELVWDRSDEARGVVTVDTARSKAVIGYGGGRRFDLGGVVVEPGASRQDGWSVVSLTAVEGDLAGGSARVLVIVTGDVENTDMGWKDAAKTTVGRDWGKAPTLVEVVPVRVALPVRVAQVRAWALDERGQRGKALAVAGDPKGMAVLELGPPQATLWYEVQVR